MKTLKKYRKGFTLIELLVVIAIIAILSVVVVLSLNPAELLRQSRDSNRISDMATLKSAISMYLADVSSTNLGTALQLTTSAATSSAYTIFNTNASTSWGFLQATAITQTNVGARTVAGSGWIPVNFSVISSGAPIGQEPVDPTNNSQYMYLYEASSTCYKTAAKLESVKFNWSGTGDAVSTDGGNSSTTLEQGTCLAL